MAAEAVLFPGTLSGCVKEQFSFLPFASILYASSHWLEGFKSCHISGRFPFRDENDVRPSPEPATHMRRYMRARIHAYACLGLMQLFQGPLIWLVRWSLRNKEVRIPKRVHPVCEAWHFSRRFHRRHCADLARGASRLFAGLCAPALSCFSGDFP